MPHRATHARATPHRGAQLPPPLLPLRPPGAVGWTLQARARTGHTGGGSALGEDNGAGDNFCTGPHEVDEGGWGKRPRSHGEVRALMIWPDSAA